MNPSKLRDVLDLLPYCNLSDTKKKAIEAIITKYLNGEIVPVVRCKDCLYYHNDISGIPFCEIWDDCFTDDDGYCYRGERKADA